MTLLFQRHWFHWRLPSSPRSRWGLQGTQWPVSRPYLQGGQGHTLPNGPSKQDTLPTVPLGQFQAQRSDNTTTESITHSDTQTPSQSEIFFNHNNSGTINNIIVTSRTSTSSQREIFSETETGTSSSKDVTHRNADMSEEAPHQTETESNHEDTSDSSSHSRTTTPSQSEISDYNANSESSSRETSRPSSPESGNLRVMMLYSPLPEMVIVHRSMHDAIHTVREQHGRAVTRSLLTQQKTLAANKLQCNAHIKRTSTPDPPSMSKS